MSTETPTHNQPAINYEGLCNVIGMSDCEYVFIDSDGDATCLKVTETSHH